MERRPDFLVIGPTRSGTSWINRCLATHPQAWVPPFKELHYFNVQRHRHFNKFYWRHLKQASARWRRFGAERRWPSDELSWHARYFLMPRNDGWYCHLFPPLRDPLLARGECSPKYCLLPDEGVERVLRINPDVKVIFLLRNPIDRAWSILARRHGRKQGRPLDTYAEDEIETFFDQIGSEHQRLNQVCLERWRGYIAPHRLHLAWFDDLNRDPIAFLGALSNFIGIDAARFPKASRLTEKHNHTTAFRPTRTFERLNRKMAQWFMDDITYVAQSLSGHAERWKRDAMQFTGAS